MELRLIEAHEFTCAVGRTVAAVVEEREDAPELSKKMEMEEEEERRRRKRKRKRKRKKRKKGVAWKDMTPDQKEKKREYQRA